MRLCLNNARYRILHRDGGHISVTFSGRVCLARRRAVALARAPYKRGSDRRIGHPPRSGETLVEGGETAVVAAKFMPGAGRAPRIDDLRHGGVRGHDQETVSVKIAASAKARRRPSGQVGGPVSTFPDITL